MSTIHKLIRVSAGFLLAFVVSDVFALCSDARHPSVSDELRSSTMVLVAKVVANRYESSPDDPRGIDRTEFSLNVVKVFEGFAENPVIVTSENTSGRFPMDVGRSYLLFIKRFNGVNIVDPCGNSGPLADKKAEIGFINENFNLSN